VFFVVKGAGRVRFSAEGAAPLAFGARDSFAIPNWAAHGFSNASEDEEAVLFCVSDEPAIRALGLYRAGG